jgi:hypothetical protein
MLKLTTSEIGLITDINMWQMINKGIRGGITSINIKHSRANNPYMTDYNEDEPTSYIVYIG